MSRTPSLPAVDMVVPVYNEEAAIEEFLLSMAGQVAGAGVPLPADLLRLVLVDNGCTDETRAIVERFAARHPDMSIVVLDEPVKSPIQARIRGASFVLRPEERARYPILANGDADTRYHPRWIWRVIQTLAGGAIDAVAFAGGFPLAFWRRMPKLAARYFREVGTVLFNPDVREHYGFVEREAMLTWQVFVDLPKMPTDCAFALSKRAYGRAGGFRREYRPDGAEIMGEGWNLRFRLDKVAASVACVTDAPYETSPRRLVGEPERWLGRRSYDHGMSDYRSPGRPIDYGALDELAASCEFDAVIGHVIENYLIRPTIGRPHLVRRHGDYFGAAARSLYRDLLAARPVFRNGSSWEIHQLAHGLTERYRDAIVTHLRRRCRAS